MPNICDHAMDEFRIIKKDLLDYSTFIDLCPTCFVKQFPWITFQLMQTFAENLDINQVILNKPKKE